MADVHIQLAAEKLFDLGPIPVTNSMVTTWIVTIILITFAYLATRKIEMVPKGLQNVAEVMVDGLQGLIDSIAPDKTKIFLPIIASFFFFILFGNYFGLLPGVGSIGFYREEETIHSSIPTQIASTEAVDTHNENVTNVTEESKEPNVDKHENTSGSSGSSVTSSPSNRVFIPYLRAINSDLNTTIALAVVSVIATHYLAIKFLGLGGYLGKFFSLNPIFLFVGLLELFGEFTKIASLSFRLFGNIFAGEVLLTTATNNLFAYIVPIPFYFLEILVGFVQALIFSMLTLVFMVILTSKSHH